MKKDAYIIRRDAVLENTTDTNLSEVCEGIDIPVEHVPFSLNKQQRWLLPEVIKTLIFESYEYIDIKEHIRISNPGLELIERHKIISNNNAIGLYCSKTEKTGNKSKIPKVTFKSRGYIDADNILGTCPLYSRNTRRTLLLNCFSSLVDEDDIHQQNERGTISKEGDVTEINKKSDVVPPVRYEVILPSDLSTCCSQKPMKTGQDTRKKLNYSGHRRPPRLIGSKRFSHSKQKRIGWRQDEIDEELQYYNETKENLHGRFERSEATSIQNVDIKHESTIETSVQKSNETPGIVKNKRNKPRKRRKQNKENSNTKVNVIEVNETRAVNVDEIKTCPNNHPMGETVVRFSMKYEPVVFLMLKDDLTKSKLQEIYGEDYLECMCYPRKFVINISRYINNLDGVGSAFKLIQIHDRQTMAWLVFIHLPSHESNSSILDAYDVHLNANFDNRVNHFKLDGMKNEDYMNISEIIGQTLAKIKSMPTDSIVFESQSKITSFINRKRLQEEMFNCTSHSYFPDSEFLIKHLSERYSAIRNTWGCSDQLPCMTSRTHIHEDLATALPWYQGLNGNFWKTITQGTYWSSCVSVTLLVFK
ncbi:hypothetical protein ACF0H5_022670 [Mactra antiquata]